MDVTVTSTGSLEHALDDLNRALTKGQKKAGADVAKVARKVILDEVKSRHRGTLSMSRMNLRALSLATKTRATPTSATVKLTGKPAGAWAITEYGTRPHIIRPRANRDALTVKGAFYEEVQHPGARGFHLWDAATRAADDELGRSVEDAFDDPIGEVT